MRGEFGCRALSFVCSCWKEGLVISIYWDIMSIMSSLKFNGVSITSNGPATAHIYSFGHEEAEAGIDFHPGLSWESLLQVLLRGILRFQQSRSDGAGKPGLLSVFAG